MGNRIIIASKSEKFTAKIRTHIVSGGYEIVAIVSDGNELVRSVTALSPEIVIIDDDLKGADLVSLIETFIFEQQPVMLIGKSHQKFHYRQSPYFEFCEKPIQPGKLMSLLRVLTKNLNTFSQLNSKVNELKEKQRTEKSVHAAKLALQKHEGMSDEEAHSYIQTRSMELQISKLEFADRINKRFENKK